MFARNEPGLRPRARWSDKIDMNSSGLGCRGTALVSGVRRHLPCWACSFLILVSGFPIVFAAEYQISPQAKVMTRLDDNIRGASFSPEAAWGFDSGGSLNLRARTETTSTELTPRVNFRRFVVGENLDADEYSVGLNNKWTNELFTTGMEFSYGRDSTLATTEAADTGLINDVVNRDSITVRPSFSYALTDRLSGNVSFLYNDVNYLDASNSGLVDYEYIQGMIGLQHSWSDFVQLFGNFYVNNFDAASIKSATRTYGGQAGVIWQWDETLDLTAQVGWEARTTSFTSLVPFPPAAPVFLSEVEEQVGTAGAVAGATIQKQFERTAAKLDYVRSISPSGRGTQSSSDRVALNVTHQLSEHLALVFDGLYETRTAQAESISAPSFSEDLNRDYTEVRGAVRYRISRDWAATGAYRFGHREATSETNRDVAETNAVFFTIDYTHAPITY